MAKTTIKQRWDLSELYSGITDPKIEKDLARIARDTVAFAKKHAGKLKTYGPAKLKGMLQEVERLEAAAYKVGLFASLLGSLDTLDGAISAFQQRVSFLLTENSNRTVFVQSELSKHPNLKEFATTDVMGDYRELFRNMQMWKKHQLDVPREQLLNTKSVTAHAGWQEMFEKVSTKITVQVPNGPKAKNAPAIVLPLETALNRLRETDPVKRETPEPRSARPCTRTKSCSRMSTR